jgi:hypothetical protein
MIKINFKIMVIIMTLMVLCMWYLFIVDFRSDWIPGEIFKGGLLITATIILIKLYKTVFKEWK